MAGLDRSESFLSLLQEHLRPNADSEPDPFIESVVVNYLLTVVYSDLEQTVHATVAAYASEGGETRVSVFVASAVKKLVRSLKCGDLAGVVGLFDASCKKHFQEAVNNTPQQAGYDRVVIGRHLQSHALGSDLTLADVARDIQHCKEVLRAFGESLRCACEHP